MAETTCAIAASYPAKAFGIKTGTLVHEARRLCPEVLLVPAHHKPYVEYHHPHSDGDRPPHSGRRGDVDR